MRLLCQLRGFTGGIVRSGIRRQARRFLATTADCRATQSRVLQELLALNAESDFSRRHQLHRARTVAEFRRCLPITDYEYVRPEIERLKRGETGALLGPRNRLLMFCLSSGTTSETKFIPITRRFLEDYRRGWQVWGIHVFDDYRRLSAQNIVQLTSDYDRYRTAAGFPCGNISGLVASMQKWVVQALYTVPRAVLKIRDSETKNYVRLRLALGDDNVGMVTTANPSTLVHLAKLGDRWREDLIRDIADGTLSRSEGIEPDVRRQLRRRVARRNRRRARDLERIVERTGHLYPRDYWPETQVVAVWTGGSAGAYLPSLRRYYGGVTVRDHGLSASEGRVTIPLHDNRPEGVLDVATHFFEFIPEEEYGREAATVLQAHELERDRTYYILLTTSSGLYRYDICDVVRCVGFYRTTPILEFLHKGAHIANVTGEKVSESQVVTAIGRCVEQTGLGLNEFTVSPVWGDPPHYRLLTEERDVPSPAVGNRLAELADAELQRVNCEYHEKRESGRLAPMRWHPLPAGTWARFARSRQETFGGSLEQYKHPCLVPDLDFCAKLLREHGRSAAARSDGPSHAAAVPSVHGPHSPQSRPELFTNTGRER